MTKRLFYQFKAALKSVTETELIKQKIVISFVICLLLSATKVFACGCGSSGAVRSFSDEVKNEVKQSTMVFAGKVVGFEYRKGIPNQHMESRIKDSGKHIDWETLVVKIQVERWWKGEAALEIFLVTDETKNSDGTVTNSSCNYKFKEGESYLVYAYGKESELRTNVCRGTGALAEAKEVLEILGEGKEPVEKKDEPNK